jgi:DUF4097 and DUF4098 domain-containing protein YvlB
MQKLAIVFFALLITVAVRAQSDREPYLTKSLSKESIKDVYARTSGGGITVTGVPESEARIEVYVAGNNGANLSKQEIKERLDEDYELEVTTSGGKLTAIAKTKSFNMSWKRNLSISFKMYVPKNVSTDLNTSGGGISLTNLAGNQNFSTSGGGLSLDKLSGRIYGRTSGGSIRVRDSKDDIDLSTSGGGIDVDNCGGNIDLSTSGGSINLNGLRGTVMAKTSGGTIRGTSINGELRAHTSGGSVNLRDISGSVDASTSGGGIDIEIDQIDKYLTASNSGGNIHLTIPGNKGLDLRLHGDRIRVESLSNFSGDQDERNLRGKINGGGPEVNVKTSGSITLAFK